MKKKKISIDDINIDTEEQINKFVSIIKKTADYDIESIPTTELDVQNMKLNIPVIMLKYNKILLKIDLQIIKLNNEYDKIYYDLYNQYKQGVLRGEKLNRFYEDREIKNLVPKDNALLIIIKTNKMLESIRKFVVNVLDELKTKSFALNNYKAIELYNN